MFFYEGLSCPVCKRAFKQNEDVVACPQCGLPHHRECWFKLGHCQQADKHGTDAQWSRDKAVHPTEPVRQTADSAVNNNICPNCRTRNREFAEFCTHCGAPLRSTEWQSSPTPPVGEYTPFQSAFRTGEFYTDAEQMGTANARDIAAVVGTNTPYYMPRFRQLVSTGKGGWNWAAFLFGPIWLLFRKQYATGAAFLFLQTLYECFYMYWSLPLMEATTNAQVESAMTSIMADSLMMPIFFLSMILFVLQILLGLRGNALYKYHCESKIQKALTNTPDLSATELSALGGTSVMAAAVGYFLSNVIPTIIIYFFT